MERTLTQMRHRLARMGVPVTLKFVEYYDERQVQFTFTIDGKEYGGGYEFESWTLDYEESLEQEIAKMYRYALYPNTPEAIAYRAEAGKNYMKVQ